MYAMYMCMHACSVRARGWRDQAFFSFKRDKFGRLAGDRFGLARQAASNAARGAEWTAAEIPGGAYAGGGGVTTGPRLIGRCAGPGRGTSWLGKLLANGRVRGRAALDDEVWKLVLVGLCGECLQASGRVRVSERVN